MAPQRTRMQTARHAAWAKWGRRHSGWFVYGYFVIKALPWVLAAVMIWGLIWGLSWAWRHVPAGAMAALAGGAAVVVLLGWFGTEVASVSAVRKGVTVQRVALGGASVALFFVALASVTLR